MPLPRSLPPSYAQGMVDGSGKLWIGWGEAVDFFEEIVAVP
jgi:hypothetical protein